MGDKHWEKWFPDGSESNEIEEAKTILKSKNYFHDTVKSLPERIKGEFSECMSHVGSRHGRNAHDQEELQESIKDLSLEKLVEYAAGSLEPVQRANSQLARSRKTTAKRYTTTTFQQLCQLYTNFLRAYGGVVDILSQVDSQYGNIASATFSLFFAVAKVKLKAEESLLSCVRRITAALPNLQVYKSIYPDPYLGRHLSKVYKEIILFGREATNFLLGSGFARLKHAIGSPFHFEAIETSVCETLTNIRHRCDALLTEQVAFLRKTMANIQSQLEAQEDRNMREQLDRIKRLLGTYEWKPDRRKHELERYRLVLNDSFTNRRHLADPSAFRFKHSPEFAKWMTAPASLLILYGQNDDAMAGEVESWLSCVALDFLESCHQKGRRVVYFLCKRSSSLRETLSHLLSQLLEQNPNLLKNGEDVAFIDSELSNGTTKGIARAIRLVVGKQDSQTFVIIDRPERCEKGSKSEFIRVLLQLTRDIGKNFKILVVQRREFWDVGKYVDELDLREDDVQDLFVMMEKDHVVL